MLEHVGAWKAETIYRPTENGTATFLVLALFARDERATSNAQHGRQLAPGRARVAMRYTGVDQILDYIDRVYQDADLEASNRFTGEDISIPMRSTSLCAGAANSARAGANGRDSNSSTCSRISTNPEKGTAE